MENTEHVFTDRLREGDVITGPTMGALAMTITGTVRNVTRRDRSLYYLVRYEDPEGRLRRVQYHKATSWRVQREG